MFAIKAAVSVRGAETFAFSAQKTMYGGKHIAQRRYDLRLRERERRRASLIASGVRHLGQNDWQKNADRPANAARKHHPQTHPRSRSDAWGGASSNFFSNWNDGRPETELNFKFCRQANE